MFVSSGWLKSALLMMLLGGWLNLPADAFGEEGKDNPLRERIDDAHAAESDWWVYNDLEEAKRIAKKNNVPIFVTFRCVPCKDCEAFDAEVADGNEAVHKLAQQEFVSVRQVEMKGVDLSQFEFDYDLNWAAMFINADGTVYARYGTQSAEGADAYNSLAGLEKTMRRVLELHKNYPGNKAELEGKRGADKPHKTAMEMPGLENKDKYKGLTTRQNCIHCHNIHDAMNAQTLTYQKEKLIDASKKFDFLWRYPLPDNIGLKINAKDGILVEEVVADSPAAKAGLQAGESITHINGQVMTSIADMQWVFHNLPNTATAITVTGSKSGEQSVKLPAGWKETDISWRASIYSLPPKTRVWMPPVTEQQKTNLKLGDTNAFEVKWINRGSLGGRAAFDGGLRQGDIVVAFEGKPIEQLTPPEFNVFLKLNYEVGQTVTFTVLRGGERKDIKIELVE